MSKIISDQKRAEVEKEGCLKKRLTPILALLLVVVITAGIFYFYRDYTHRIDELKTYGYLGAFIISLTFNATVILPVGNILILAALGAILPSAVIVGLLGGVGASIGEITGYMVGYSGRAVVGNRQTYIKVEGWMKRWGAITIFVFSVIPFVFDLAGIAAGILRYPLWKFLFFCWLGRTILYVGAALAGAWGWETVLHYLS